MLGANDGKPVPNSKAQLAIKAAVAACDELDGVKDGVLRDPRGCSYSATELVCKPGKAGVNCLTAGEAKAIDMIWCAKTALLLFWRRFWTRNDHTCQDRLWTS